jgi:3-hydroxyphenylacetate 6-hydroxylase
MAVVALVATGLNFFLANPALCGAFIPVIIILSYILVNEFVRFKARIPSFTGPKGYPIFGNIPQLKLNAPEKYRQWAQKYGAVFQIQLGNIPVLVVNSASQAKEIFLTNSRGTNSRPMFYTFHKVVSSTAGFTIGTSPMTESLKRRRKAAATALNRPAVQSYIPHVDLETKEFVKECLELGLAGNVAIDPLPIIQRLSLNLSLTLNWGTRIDSLNDPLFAEITEVEEYVSRFRSTTGNLQDYVPLYRWNPLAKDNAVAADMRRRRDIYLTRMNKELDEKIANKTYKPCIQANILLDPEAKLNAAELMSISLTMVSGGLDTITTLVVWAVALLATRPDIQKNALAAIREHFSEQEVLCDPIEDQKCAYIVALVREFLRFYTPLRLALPRLVENPFKYQGKKVPKGTVVFLNAWACNMDPELFENPFEFRPERFLENPAAPIFTYGQGSRMCAGFLLGNRELYLLFMRLISSFDIQKSEEVDVNPLTGIEDPTSLVSTPKRYKCIFKPRNEQNLRQALDNYKPVSSG